MPDHIASALLVGARTFALRWRGWMEKVHYAGRRNGAQQRICAARGVMDVGDVGNVLDVIQPG